MSERAKIHLGDIQCECLKRGMDCEKGGVVCDYRPICHAIKNEMPLVWDLRDPPRFNEAQMALLSGWFDFGARSIARESADPSYLTLYGEPAVIVGLMKQSGIAEKLPVLKRITLAELLGKDGEK